MLMQRAGTAAAAEISRRYAARLRNGTVVFTGPGNNGGDGWAVAGILARDGVEVVVVEVEKASRAKSPDAVAEREAAIGLVKVADSIDYGGAVVIDGLLGTGFEGEPRGQIAGAIARINELHRQGARVASLDVPSGLDATTGQHSACVEADLTLSFGGVKRGTLLARDCCGEIVALDIGLDEHSVKTPAKQPPSELPLPILVDGEWLRSRIPAIRYDAHKGIRKHLAVIGAGKGMPGAVVLVSRGALRSGIGLLRVLVAPDNARPILCAVPSALISDWPSTANQISAEISKWADAIVIGPGLGKSKETKKLVERILGDSKVPALLDADALNVFQDDAKSLAKLLEGRQALITPHPAEFGRLAGIDVDTVLANRFDVGLDLSRELGATVLLKGSPTVVFSPHGGRYVIARGTAALGTGGSGDLLDGIAGTMLAQMLDATAAGCCAAWVHGRAAELCEYVRGTTLEDVLYALPRAWSELEPLPEPPVLAELPAVAR
ncbi:MAG: bifunctional ADP-dependent NAD(P)H-hydrate dehydratase/NAD(P)H-hydrate epimerase [Gemmatimonadaceae bacterium]